MKLVSLFSTNIFMVVICFGMNPVHALGSADVRVGGNEPSAIDERHYTSGRKERHQPTQSVQSKGVAKSDCGNRAEVDSKRAGTRLIQLSDLLKLPNESETTECLRSPNVTNCGIEPSLIDERHYTSGRSMQLWPNQSSNRVRVEDCCTSDVLETALVYPGGSSFDPGIWKTDKSKRFTMLFDLYHQHWKDYSTAQVISILGAPDETSINPLRALASKFRIREGEILGLIYLPKENQARQSETHDILYDFCTPGGKKASMVLSFTDDKLLSLRFKQIRGSDATTPWQCTNLTWEGLAKDYNRKYMIVGMPANLVARIFPSLDSPRNDVPSNTNGPLEIQFTPDGSKVLQFRVRYETAGGHSGITEWVNENLRTDERCLTKESDYQNLRGLSSFAPPFDVYLDLMAKFNKKSWNESRRDFSQVRLLMLNSLLRSFPLIGMKRTEVHRLIGKGEIEAYIPQTVVSTEPNFRDSEFYQLSSHWCGNAGIDRLQIAYKDNVVCGYRTVLPRTSSYSEVSLTGRFYFAYAHRIRPVARMKTATCAHHGGRARAFNPAGRQGTVNQY